MADDKDTQRLIEMLISELDSYNSELAKLRLTEIGEPAVPVLIDALKNPGGNVWLGAFEVLAKIGEPAVPALLDALKNVGPGMRSDIARILGKIGDSRAMPALISILGDNSFSVQSDAYSGLSELALTLLKKGEYSCSLEIIKALAIHTRKEYKGKKDRDSLKERRIILAELESLTKQTHDKMNPLDKREPMEWKRPRKGAKSVYKPFSSKTVYTR